MSVHLTIPSSHKLNRKKIYYFLIRQTNIFYLFIAFINKIYFKTIPCLYHCVISTSSSYTPF
uniref:Uncharacterized protein n=1 Tax=Siphoviridae sp. ctqPo10 TaxID=2827948 RepID=A0A8S5SUT5_9CAUD|nr:MAG TPA: hypothetical protein [Siphoviridae sp. ctqPo10]DAI19768.1 MAG TPA: hypothetical protein [Caudoviricetes sp.]